MKFEINEVLNKSDLLSYVVAAGGKPEKSGSRYSCACMLHGGKNETAFSIYFESGKWKWHCFTDSCGGGDAISFVEQWQFPNESDPNKRFKMACEWILNGTISDTEALYVSAGQRLEEAKLEEIAARERKEARIKELQLSEKHLYYHNMRENWGIEMWRQRGLDEGMQDFFILGACSDFTYWTKDMEYHSPTLSIPYFGEQMELLNIQHRLINPKNPKDKYRPDIKGAGKLPYFLAVPTMGFDGGLIIVVEGAIKSMVAWSRMSETDVQAVGVPVQGGYMDLCEVLKGKNVVIIPDPAIETEHNKRVLQQPYDLAKSIGAKILNLPEKVDDYLLQTDMNANQFFKVIKQARRV